MFYTCIPPTDNTLPARNTVMHYHDANSAT